MALTQQQIEQLNRVSINQLLEYYDRGLIKDEDIQLLAPERQQLLLEELKSRPNSIEQQEWAQIANSSNEPQQSQKMRLEAYVSKWESIRPNFNHVDEAIEKLKAIDAEIEATEWNMVNHFDVESLYDYLRRFPRSVHKAEIENSVWNIIKTTSDSSLVTMVMERYKTNFPDGVHVAEADAKIGEFNDWMSVKTSGDIFAVNDYLKRYPNGQFSNEANLTFAQLKQREEQEMRVRASSYSADRLSEIIKQGIYAPHELIARGICTKHSLETLSHYESIKKGLPNMPDVMQRCESNCSVDRTDVYLFGIPSTGKSCILMGLIGSPMIDINTVRNGGPYAAALQQYLDVGITIPRTPGNFVTSLEADIFDTTANGQVVHQINLVEMAGETFADKLADNPDGHISFDDMGHGATELLCNDNRKVFFVIVDPTTDNVEIQVEKEVRNPATGDFLGYTTKTIFVKQHITLKRFVDLLRQPENIDVMRNVDAIHVIVTKSDMLGSGHDDRLEEALRRFNERYARIITPLVQLCREHDINRATNGVPMLFTFSLGKFYVGGIYEYDEEDANKLVDVIRGNTGGTKERTFYNKLQDFFNKPLF